GRNRNSKIDGYYAQDPSEWSTGEHQHPIIPKELWHQVQLKLVTNSYVGQERKAGPQYALTGLVHCSECERRVSGRPDNYGKSSSYVCPRCKKAKATSIVESKLRSLMEEIQLGTSFESWNL